MTALPVDFPSSLSDPSLELAGEVERNAPRIVYGGRG